MTFFSSLLWKIWLSWFYSGLGICLFDTNETRKIQLHNMCLFCLILFVIKTEWDPSRSSMVIYRANSYSTLDCFQENKIFFKIEYMRKTLIKFFPVNFQYKSPKRTQLWKKIFKLTLKFMISNYTSNSITFLSRNANYWKIVSNFSISPHFLYGCWIFHC